MACLIQSQSFMKIQDSNQATETTKWAKPSQETRASTPWSCLWNVFPNLETLLRPIEPGQEPTAEHYAQGVLSSVCWTTHRVMRAVQGDVINLSNSKIDGVPLSRGIKLSRDVICGKEGQ